MGLVSGIIMAMAIASIIVGMILVSQFSNNNGYIAAGVGGLGLILSFVTMSSTDDDEFREDQEEIDELKEETNTLIGVLQKLDYAGVNSLDLEDPDPALVEALVQIILDKSDVLMAAEVMEESEMALLENDDPSDDFIVVNSVYEDLEEKIPINETEIENLEMALDERRAAVEGEKIRLQEEKEEREAEEAMRKEEEKALRIEEKEAAEAMRIEAEQAATEMTNEEIQRKAEEKLARKEAEIQSKRQEKIKIANEKKQSQRRKTEKREQKHQQKASDKQKKQKERIEKEQRKRVKDQDKRNKRRTKLQQKQKTEAAKAEKRTKQNITNSTRREQQGKQAMDKKIASRAAKTKRSNVKNKANIVKRNTKVKRTKMRSSKRGRSRSRSRGRRRGGGDDSTFSVTHPTPYHHPRPMSNMAYRDSSSNSLFKTISTGSSWGSRENPGPRTNVF